MVLLYTIGMGKCKALAEARGMFHGVRPCKNNALEGSDFCHIHNPNRVSKPRDEGKENYKRALFLAKLRNRGKK